MKKLNVTGPKIVSGPPGPKVSAILKGSSQGDGDYVSPLMDRADGIYIQDPDGNVFIDFISGRCVANTGHNHPRINHSIKNQLKRGFHWQTKEIFSLITRLGEMTKTSPCQVYWGQSGSIVNDFAIKAVRRITGRYGILSFTGSYHGSSIGGAH